MAEQQQINETASVSPQKIRRVIDDREAWEADSLEEMVDKLVESKRHASRKIREQDEELCAWRGKGEKEAGVSRVIGSFVAVHDDYENEGPEGERNGELMRMKLNELRLPVTEENLSSAYSHLKAKGLLTLKAEPEPEPQIVQVKAEPVPQRVRKSSIGTHSRSASVPVNAETSEADAYKMPLEQLRELANKQLREAR